MKKIIWLVLAFCLVFTGTALADPDCSKSPNSKKCEVVDPLPEPDPAAGYPCPAGYVYLDFYQICVERFAARPADFCEKHPEHKHCQVNQPNGDGYCPEGTVYIDTWGCVPY